MLSPLFLMETPLPWVEKVKHLGYILEPSNTMRIDYVLKKGENDWHCELPSTRASFCAPYSNEIEFAIEEKCRQHCASTCV